MADADPSELDQLRRENALLIGLLEALGIAWRLVATAILHLLLHHSHVLTIRGDSYRIPRGASSWASCRVQPIRPLIAPSSTFPSLPVTARRIDSLPHLPAGCCVGCFAITRATRKKPVKNARKKPLTDAKAAPG